MIGYNPSHLNKNETLLEAFHRVEAYLKANPQYQVYQSSAQYQEDTQLYTLNTIIVPKGSKVSAGDVVFFSNAYYSVITDVSELTFSVEYASNFRGPQGPKGDPGVRNANLSNTAGTSDTDGYTQKAVNGIVQNPNLLINPNFAINQRGQASYTSQSGWTYCFDRWRISPGSTCTVGTKTFSSQSPCTLLDQIVEDYKQLQGNTVTLSLKIKAYNGNVDVRIVDSTDSVIKTVNAVGVLNVTKEISSDTSFVRCSIISNGVSNITIEWAKLEIGSVATTFSPPSIAEELPKCQRYYQIRTNSYTIEPNAIDRPIPMRVNGTIGTTTINSSTYNYADAEI